MRKSISWIIIGVLGLFIFLPFIFQFYYPEDSFIFRGDWCMWPMHFGMGGMWIFPTIMLIVVLFFLSSYFGRGEFRSLWYDSHKHQESNKDSESALEILKKRYAKGEINKNEFKRMKDDLLS